MIRVLVCPVCNGNGNGLVPNRFYLQTSDEWTTGSLEPEICKSCNGRGYVVLDITDEKVNHIGNEHIKVK